MQVVKQLLVHTHRVWRFLFSICEKNKRVKNYYVLSSAIDAYPLLKTTCIKHSEKYLLPISILNLCV